MSTPLLTITQLHTDLNTAERVVHAVQNVSFTLNAGETFCLVGESGSGKSITALSIMRLLPDGLASHPQGSIVFQGQNLLQADVEQLRAIRGAKIGMIFQEPMTSLNPVMTIGAQIMESLQWHYPEMADAAAQTRALAALEQVQIPRAAERFHDYPHQLSGGQRQRVMIAMALACRPTLLIADEPTTALDVTVQAEILRLMQQLQRDTGMSILFITHDFGVVAQMAHQVGVMHNGQLVEVGAAAQVLQQPQHPYTQRLLAALPENLHKPVAILAANSATQEPSVSDALVTIRDLNVWFPIKKGLLRRTVDHNRAVDGVSLSIPRGQIMALVGESGCGKTTLGRAILQLEKPTAGSIQLEGQELVGLSARALRPLRPKMQIAFQDPQSSLNPRLRIVQTLTEPMQVHGIGQNDEERLELAAAILHSVQLNREHLWRYPHEFSGGQRQRIGLARALVLNPRFLVCDEITSALDVSVQAEILQLLLTIREERDLTLLFITHNIAVVEYLSDQTVVMYQGKVVEQGATAQVCRAPQHPYTQKLLAAVPRLIH